MMFGRAQRPQDYRASHPPNDVNHHFYLLNRNPLFCINIIPTTLENLLGRHYYMRALLTI